MCKVYVECVREENALVHVYAAVHDILNPQAFNLIFINLPLLFVLLSTRVP